MLNDLRIALRGLRRSPGPAAVAVLVIGLGIGANAVVFTLLDGFLFRPLDFAAPERLVRLFGTQESAGRERQNVTEATFFEWRRSAAGFEGLAAARNMGLAVTESETPLNPLMREVTGGYFELLGARPALGRTFAPDEHRPGAGAVAVLSHGFWLSYFGGDPGVLGRTLELARRPHEVIGVMPAGYRNPAVNDDPVLWLPLAEQPVPDDRQENLRVAARLAPGTSPAATQEEMDRISEQLAALDPARREGRGVRVVPLHDSLVETLRPALWVLFGAVALLLLIACGNVANLLLARAIGRRREIAVRVALGAGRLRVARQLLVESLLLGLAGAALGLLLASWGLGPLTRLVPETIDVPLLDRVQLDLGVVAFTAAAAVVTSVLFGLAPLAWAFRASAGTPFGTRATGGRERRRMRGGLVVTEVALSVVLLVGAGLALRAFVHLAQLDPGFDPRGLLAFRAGARGPGFDLPEQRDEFIRRVVDGLRALPGVEGAAACQFPPLFRGFGFSVPVTVAGDKAAAGGGPGAQPMRVTPGFFDVYGLPLLAGRGFDLRDGTGREPVAVLSAGLARELFGDRDPLGRAIEFDGERRRVVGVAGDVRGVASDPGAPSYVYLPYAQSPGTLAMTVLARTAGEPLTLARPAEQVVWEISRDAPAYGATTMEQMLADTDWRPRFLLQLLAVFALLALVLATSGIYAVLAAAVVERTREVGIRVAVGARRGDVLAMVLADAGRLALAGIAVGLVLAVAASRLLEGQLQGVGTLDPTTYAAVSLLLLAVALAAGAIPALRATRIDPVKALRAE
jgi:predicted permease